MQMNIAVLTKNWLGDVIFESPAIRAIKENFPESHLIAVTPRRCVEILEANPYVDEVIVYGEAKDERSFFRQLNLIYRLRKRKIDRAYLFHRSATRAFLVRCAGISERIGYRTKGRGMLLSHSVLQPKEPVHRVQYFLDLLRTTGHRIQNDYQYEFYFKPDDLEKAEALLTQYHLDSNRLIAINAGANWPPKRWPASHFGLLASRLIDRFGIQVVLTGSTEDAAIANQILNYRNGSSIVSICGKTTIRQLGALFSKCRLVISNDTGPLHVAAGVGTNVLGIFGPTAPRETAPLGRGKNVLIHYCPEGVQLPWIGKEITTPWMELITVDEVFQTIEKEKLLLK